MSLARREVTVPAEAFDHLRAAVGGVSGERAGIQALHAAGFSTGPAVCDLLLGDDVDGAGRLGMAAFRDRLSTWFRDRGWGSFEADDPHPGVSLLRSGDWAEAETGEDGHPTCAFTSGILSSLLSQVAGAPVSVLETSCRARGDEDCTFAFGSERTIQDLYQALLDGHALHDAIGRL